MEKMAKCFLMVMAMFLMASVVKAEDTRQALMGDFQWLGGEIWDFVILERPAGEGQDFVPISRNPYAKISSFDELMRVYQNAGYDMDVTITIRKKPGDIPIPTPTGTCGDNPWDVTSKGTWDKFPNWYYATFIYDRGSNVDPAERYKWKLIQRQNGKIIPIDCIFRNYYPTISQLNETWGNSTGDFYPWGEDIYIFQ